MQLTITQNKNNILLQRHEVKGNIQFEGVTPSNKMVAEELNKEIKGETVLKHIYTQFGHQEAEFFAYVYASKEARDTTEQVTNHLRKKLEEQKKAEIAAK